MGILNVTPDSFYDGGKLSDKEDMIDFVGKMLEEGANIIDVGGVSTRPGAAKVSKQEELDRVIPAIELLQNSFEEIILSVDTFRADVVRQAYKAGAVMVNDISGGRFDEKLFETVAELQMPYVLMHMQGTPETMQQNPVYEDVVLEITDFFIERLHLLRKAGVKDVILDPGFGFGKTTEHNYEILKSLPNFRIFDLPILTGLSRKSMICKPLKVNPANALNGTTALHSLALSNGANMLRVHDVYEAKEVIELMEIYNHI